MEDRKKVLVITGTSFRVDTNNGKTLRALFSKFNPDEIAQIYFSPEIPNCADCSSYYRVFEKQLIKSFLGIFGKKCGGEVQCDPNSKKAGRYSSKLTLNKGKTSVMLLRELLWDISHWKNRSLRLWLDKVNPSAIFAFLPGNKKTAKFISWVAKRYNCKVVMLATDDHYNDYEITPSLLRKLRYRRMQKAIDSIAKYSDIMLGCSELTAKEYGERFNLPYEAVFTPSAKEFLDMQIKEQGSSPVIFRYFGNVELERWKVLKALGEAIKIYNNGEQKAKLEIYTSLEDREIIDALTIDGACEYKGFVQGNAFYDLVSSADVAVHVESFSPQMMKYTRLSVSTKIADYLGAGKCILAIGPDNLASISHISPVSMVANRIEDLPSVVEKLINEPKLRDELQEKARTLSKKEHDIEKIGTHMRSILLGE